MDNIINIVCPCCNQKIELTISESGEITALFCCDSGIEFGSLKGGEKLSE